MDGAVGARVDPVDAAPEPEAAAVGQDVHQGGAAVQSEGHLYCNGGGLVLGTPFVVVDEEGVQVAAQPFGVPLPQQATAGQPPGLGQGELLVADLGQPLSLSVAPGCARSGKVAGSQVLGDEAVEHLVGQGAPVHCGDALVVLWLVGHTHPKHMFHEVGVWAAHPGLQPGG